MIKIRYTSFILVCISLLAYGCKKATPTSNKVTVAVAANMQFAIADIIAAYEAESETKVEVIVNSSGKLTAQIVHGAPIDVFISADTKYPLEIERKGLAQQSPRTYATGALVLWTLQNDVHPALEELTSEKIRHIAVANPETAPYGVATIEVLKNKNLLDSVLSKLVYAESISQTNQFITSGSAEVGFTALSVVSAPKMKEVGSWIRIDTSLHQPLRQDAVLLKSNNGAASNFYDFLFSKKAQEVLLSYGFDIN